jgi:hypothetical protein
MSTSCSEKSKEISISGFRREVAENCALLGYYAASSGNFSCHYSLRNNPEEQSSQRKFKFYKRQETSKQLTNHQIFKKHSAR